MRSHLGRACPACAAAGQPRWCFEAVVVAIETGGLLDVLAHPNPGRYPDQRILVVEVNGSVYLIPYVEADDHLFLKTIIPSRKATRAYLHRDTP
ncbi:toxin [Cyanobium sp. ATX 6A2]|nr:toxin [Cyanobium sp. ATX 6A2]